MKMFVHKINQAGFQAVVMVRRGMDKNYLKTVSGLNGYITEDVFAAADFLNKHFDNPNLYSVGWSHGAGLMLKAAGIAGEKYPFKA